MTVEYRVRAMSLLDLVNDVKAKKLIPDAFFQRNLVWREIHKKEFIETILLGLPFPQIFISKGKVDVETMSTVSCIVDGQQRTDAIMSFINDVFDVNGKKYSQLSDDEKSTFLKYEIAAIELDLENDDPQVQDLFQRINRTSNSLTSIEKLASEYSTSEYMLTAKLLCDQIDLERLDNDDFKEDPNIPESFYVWAKEKEVNSFSKLITQKDIFTQRDISKKAHLMHVLNIISTYIGGFFNRNENTHEFLNNYSEDFPDKDDVIDTLESAAEIILEMELDEKSYWYNKSNIFSLIVTLAFAVSAGLEIDSAKLKAGLESFEKDLPDDYKLAATEAVNNKKQRQLREKYLIPIISAAKN